MIKNGLDGLGVALVTRHTATLQQKLQKQKATMARKRQRKRCGRVLRRVRLKRAAAVCEGGGVLRCSKNMSSVLSMGVAGDGSSGYQFVALKPDVQVQRSIPQHANFNFTSFQACAVCGSAEEDDDGACASCGTVLPAGEMFSDIDGRAPAFGYQVTHATPCAAAEHCLNNVRACTALAC